MAKQFIPILSLLALAGSKPAMHEAAVEALTRATFNLVKHGNATPILDTLTALETCKGSNVARVRLMVDTAHGAAMGEWGAHKKAHPDVEGAVARIIDAACIAYAEAEKAAETKRKAAKVEKAKAKAKADRAEKQAAKAIADAAAARPLTLADCGAFLRAALASGSMEAAILVADLSAEFVTVREIDEPVTA